MDINQGAQAAQNVVNLFDDNERADQQCGSLGMSSQTLTEVMTANPRFSAPANDEPEMENAEPLAPTRADCRQARLLCMWIDILADSESA